MPILPQQEISPRCVANVRFKGSERLSKAFHEFIRGNTLTTVRKLLDANLSVFRIRSL